MKRFTAIFEHGDKRNQWVVHIKQKPEVHTFGRGLSQARARIREALETWLGENIEFEIVEELPIAPGVVSRIGRLQERQDQIAGMVREQADARAEVVASLRGAWSLRDIASVLGVTFQRVHQVRHSRARRRNGKR